MKALGGITVLRGKRAWTITLDRPEKLNALDDALCRALHSVLRELAEKPEVAALVIRGAGRAFSAGADLASGAFKPRGSAAVRRFEAGRWQRLLDELERIPQVTIAVLHGWVIGGAALLAASCDLRIASHDVKIRIPEIAMGIPLTWGGNARLAREIGIARARDLVMTGRTLDALTAESWGFVTRLAAPQELEKASEALLRTLLGQPAGALAQTRGSFAALSRADLATSWADADLLAYASAEPEVKAALARYGRHVRRNKR